MLIAAYVTVFGGIAWEYAWKKKDYFFGFIGLACLTFAFVCVMTNFNL